MRPMTKQQRYAGLVLLLLVQLLIRAHNITELPVFIDENNHMYRAANFRDLSQHPAEESHGKFFFYFLLNATDLRDRDTALHLARTTVALASLLTSAILFALVKRLTRRPDVGLLAVAFYGMVPYAFFYERMALADPWAGTLGLLTAWQSVRLAKQPSYRLAAIVGICAAMTVAAKLTMSFAVGFPVLAFLAFAPYTSLMDAIRRYMPYLITAGIVFIVVWLPVLIPARLSIVSEDLPDFILINTELIDQSTTPDSLTTKLTELWTKLTAMTHPIFAVIGVLGTVGLALWRDRRHALFLLGCLALAWLPGLPIVENLQTRYLMAGIPLLAALMAIGVAASVKDRHLMPYWWGGFAIWVVAFAAPFAVTLATTPPDVTVPPLDDQNYFWDRYNGYGNREAFAELATLPDAVIPVFPLTKICPLVDLYATDTMHITCLDGYFREMMSDIEWQSPLQEALAVHDAVYVLTSEQPDAPPQADEFTWELIGAYDKPRAIQTVYLWQVRLAD